MPDLEIKGGTQPELFLKNILKFTYIVAKCVWNLILTIVEC